MSKTKRAPIGVVEKVACRSCGLDRHLDHYRIFTASPRVYMDFCSMCEQAHGTLGLYRRFNAYGTPQIVDAVFAVSRIPAGRRTPEQARLVIEQATQIIQTDTIEQVVDFEMRRRELARRRLLYFATTMMPGYQPGWVHQDMCRQLEDFMRQVENEQSPRLMICVPPRHGKSQLGSDLFPSWVLGHHPDWPIILSSYAQSLPIKFSRSIRDKLSDPEYQAIFPNTKVRSDAKGVEEWETTKKGVLKAAGVGTGITGFGFRIGILDDPIKDQEEAQSDLIRDNTFEWYQTVFRTRAAPGAGILIINTRWHFDDPSGRLLSLDAELTKNGVPENERENWKLVVYPAIAEADENLMRDGSIASGEQEPGNVLRLLRKKGEALHPERYPLRELLKIKNNLAPSMWTSLYQQQPAPDDGDFFNRDQFMYRWFDHAYRPLCPRFMTVDYAIGKKARNDYTVMGAWLLDWDDNLVLLEARRGRFGTMEIVDNVVQMVEAHDIQTYAGEQGQIHLAVWPMIEAALMKKRIYLTVDDTLVPMQDKEVRARPLQGRMQRNKLLFSYDTVTKPEIIDIMEREFLQFPNGANDDCVDMCAWAARLAQNLPIPKNIHHTIQKLGWKDKLRSRVPTRSAQAG